MAMVMMMEACDDTDFGGDDGAADVGNDELRQKHILMRIRSCLSGLFIKTLSVVSAILRTS